MSLPRGVRLNSIKQRPFYVLLADDHEIVVEGLRRVLETDFNVVGIVADGLALIEGRQRN